MTYFYKLNFLYIIGELATSIAVFQILETLLLIIPSKVLNEDLLGILQIFSGKYYLK